MPRTVQFEGVTHVFPDDFSDADVAKALNVAHGSSAGSGPVPGMEQLGGTPPAYPSAKPPEMDEQPSLLTRLGQTLNPVNMVKQLGQIPVAPDPMGVALGVSSGKTSASVLADQIGAQADKVGLGKAALSAIPVVNDIADKNYQGAVGQGLGMGVGLLAGRYGPTAARAVGELPSKAIDATISKFPNVNNAKVNAALDSIAPDVEMTVGQRTGSPQLQHMEKASGMGEEFYPKQEQQIADLAQKVMGSGNDNITAGNAVNEQLGSVFNRQKSQADKLYNSIRQDFANAKQTVPNGTENTGLFDASGKPILRTKYAEYAAPVDISMVQKSLKPMYDELTTALPEGRRAFSSSYAALKHLMEYSDQYMSAPDLDKYLGGVKRFIRDGENPYLTDQSQGLAKQIVKYGEQQMRQALDAAGPDTASKLLSARKLVQQYHDIADLKAMVNNAAQEPGHVFSVLSAGRDNMINTLTELSKVAPDAVKKIGDAYLEAMLDKATAEGGFGRGAKILNDWNNLGSRTKELLYGTDRVSRIDNTLLAAKKLVTPVNPSGSGLLIATMRKAMGLGKIGVGTLTVNPKMVVGGIADVAPFYVAKRLFPQAAMPPATAPLNLSGPAVGAALMNAFGGNEDDNKWEPKQ